MRVRCDLVRGTIRFDRAGEVLAVLEAVTDGWGLRPAPPDEAPCVLVTGNTGSFGIAEPGFRSFSEASAVSAACSLVAVLVNRMVNEGTGRLCLHAAAVSAGGRTLVFPSTHRAGKSTLVAALAFAGHRVIADDVLPLDAGPGRPLAIAPGVAPRLRLPLPAALGDGFRRAARRLAGPEDDHYRYLALPPSLGARYGERSDVGAVVLLERRPGPARLQRIGSGQVTRALIAQNFGRTPPPARIVARIGALAAAAPGFLLGYHDLDEAVFLLSGDLDTAAEGAPDAAPAIGRDPLRGPGRLPMARRVARAPGVHRSEQNGEAFLVDPGTGAIFVLDRLGDAIWDLLDEPATPADVAKLVAAAFPGSDPALVRADVARFLATLRDARLIGPASRPGATLAAGSTERTA